MGELSDALAWTGLWSRTYERHVEDLFNVQEEIAESIVRATGGELIRAGSEHADKASPDELDAWGLVRKAYHFWNYGFILPVSESRSTCFAEPFSWIPATPAPTRFWRSVPDRTCGAGVDGSSRGRPRRSECRCTKAVSNSRRRMPRCWRTRSGLAPLRRIQPVSRGAASGGADCAFQPGGMGISWDWRWVGAAKNATRSRLRRS